MTSPIRRPRRDISRASRNDATAAPSTWKVCASPAWLSEPERSRASSEAVAMPIVMPIAPTAWARHEGADRPALDGGEVGRRAATPGAHRSVAGSSRARQTAAQTCLGGTPASRASCAVRPPSSPMTYWSAHERA